MIDMLNTDTLTAQSSIEITIRLAEFALLRLFLGGQAVGMMVSDTLVSLILQTQCVGMKMNPRSFE